MALPPLRLKKGEDRRIRAGHLWVFSNEVDTQSTPLVGLEPGEPVDVLDSRGAPLGSGYVNPHSLICARLVHRKPGRPLDGEMLRQRMRRALELRERLYPGAPWYRLIYGEGDGIPGLVVDRFDSLLVAQITTAGIERLKGEVVEALAEVVPGASILLRNDTGSRSLEGLDSYVEAARGVIPERAEVVENGVRFEVALGEGQKTGWFYDHRESRARLSRYVDGARVLDVFSYVGGWGIQAAVAGAQRVVCIDSSASALEGVRRNASLNGLDDRVETLQAQGKTVIMCPPPNEHEAALRNAPSARCLPPLPLGAFARLCQQAQWVICNDSGVSHVAAAIKAQQLTLCGVTNPEDTGPWSPRATGSARCTACRSR